VSLFSKIGARKKALQACEKTLQAFMDSARLLDPGEVSPPQIVKHIRNQYYVKLGPDENWSGDAVRFVQIGARDVPVQFYRTQIVASAQAAPISYVDGLNFIARDEQDNIIPYLPLELEDRRKRLLLIFMPPIRPSSLRSVRSTYSWNGMWNQLKRDGQESLEWPHYSKEPCELFEIEVFWDPRLQHTLDFRLIADAMEFEVKHPVDNNRHWPGRGYLIRNVQPGTSIKATLSVGPPQRWPDVPGLHSIAEHGDNVWGDVIFVHGLAGNPATTWHPADRPDLFWPELLAIAFPLVNVWSIGYPAHPSAWGGTSRKTMSLEERATNILALMEARALGKKPLLFVCHSYGGLVAKQMLRSAMDGSHDNWRDIATKTKGIFFLSTPHSGSDVATFLERLAIVLQTTDIVRELGADEAYLLNLNRWYKENARKEPLNIDTKVLYEKFKTGPLLVVDRASADPGMSGVTPIAVDEDHVSICKPKSSEAPQVMFLRELVNKVLAPAAKPADAPQ
jgi:pimeloyl-ACP methyl ester carboxylesterase